MGLESEDSFPVQAEGFTAASGPDIKGYKGYKGKGLSQDVLFNSKNVYSQPESGSVAKDVMGKIQVHDPKSDWGSLWTLLVGVNGGLFPMHAAKRQA
eukprot:1154241-Pelagomonas_calceolata.AAC.2